MTAAAAVSSVLVVGTGLIGTSIGLALQGELDVLLDDVDDTHRAAAVQRGAGRPWDRVEPVDLAVVCIPPRHTGAVMTALTRSGLATTVSHVASRQSGVQAEVEADLGDDDRLLGAVCGGHPIAGREVRGPSAARADVFRGRPWAVCPGPRTGAEAVRAVEVLAERCGAFPVRLAPDDHDRAVALVSHLPQLAASALAARLVAGGAGDDATRALAGPGLQDTTRIAASDPDLWVDVLRGNAPHVAPLARALADELHAVAEALAGLAADPQDPAATARVRSLLERGRQGRAALPVKDRAAARDLTPVVVRLPDRPGQLAAVLVCAATAGVNVEDLRVEHLPGRPTGLVELLVAGSGAPAARAALAADGWDVVG